MLRNDIESGSGNMRHQKDWNLKVGSDDNEEEEEEDMKEQNEIGMEEVIDEEGMHSRPLDALKRRAQRDPPATADSASVTVPTADSVSVTLTSGHPATDPNAPYTLPSGNLADAKNTLQSHSVAAVAAGVAIAAQPPTTATTRFHGRGVTDKNTMQSSSSGQYSNGAAVSVPTWPTHFAPPNQPSLSTEAREHLLVAIAIPDSELNIASSGSNQATVEAPGRCWKPLHVLLGMILIVLTALAVIGGVCGTGGCSTSSANRAVPTSPPTTMAITVPSPTRPSTTVAPTMVSPTTNTPTINQPTVINETTPFPIIDPSVASTASLSTAIPTMAPRAEQLATFVNSITLTGRTLAAASVDNSTSGLEPEELALQWLIDYDTALNLLPNTPPNRFRLQQRYALAILWVQSNDFNAFFGSTGDECDWDGVTCETVTYGNELGIQQAVTEILIVTNNNSSAWTGQLSADLGLLSTLTHFTMSGGDTNRGGLSGSLPSQIGQLTSLQVLSVFGNGLTGSMPSQIGQLTNLQELNVAWNAVNGSLPSEIGRLISLKILNANGNDLMGSLSSQIGQMTSLEYLNVYTNDLTGSLLTQIGQLTNLQHLDVGDNALTGSLPTPIGQLTKLDYLDVSGNALTGSLPVQIGGLTNLIFVYAYANNFTGTMPESICLLRNLSLTVLQADCVSEVSCNADCCTLCV
jgi:Leucine-rich repeat (LRR) protein